MISYKQQIALWANYGWSKLYEQLKPVLCVVLYLLLCHIFVFNEKIDSLWKFTLGTASILFGLSLFLESVRLSVMPLAEMSGFYLRKLFPLFIVFFIALILGAIATIAEPAVAVFQQTQGAFSSDSTSLVALIIRSHRSILAWAIAIGLGTATGLGIIKTAAEWPLKIVLAVLIIIALALSIFAFLNTQTQDLVSLAWDAGGVATGPITVAFMISFGLGVNRGNPKEGSGLGIIALATLLPVIFMLIFGLGFYYLQLPGFVNFSSISPVLAPKALDMTLLLPKGDSLFSLALKNALQATIPIIFSLGIVIFVIVRKKVPLPDEKVLGLVFLVFGSMTFTLGIENGILPLGENIGSSAINVIRPSEQNLSKSVLIHDFNLTTVQTGYNEKGDPIRFFYLVDQTMPSKSKTVEFLSQYYNAEKNTYLYIPNSVKNIFTNNGNQLQGYIIILLFSFILGIVITALEPTLITFAKTIEETTAGTMPSSFLIKFVAIGAGAGLAFGVLRLLLKIPFTPVICLTYFILLILTLVSKNDVVEIAWDAAGATTGPITIPLVIALQVGLGKATHATDVFGIIALTCAFPAILMLIHGQYMQAKEHKRLNKGLSL